MGQAQSSSLHSTVPNKLPRRRASNYPEADARKAGSVVAERASPRKASPAVFDGVRRVLARNVKKEPIGEPPADASVFFFETQRGQRVCWKMASQSAQEFADSGLIAANQQFFKGTSVRVFFPVQDMYYATKTFRGMGNITLERVLRCVEQAASSAVAFHLQNDLKQAGVTTQDVTARLKRVVVCHLLLRRIGGGNRVYVRLSGGSI